MVKVFIAVPTADIGRRPEFYDYLDVMDKPDGTVSSRAHGQSPARNRNIMIQQALDHNCTHIAFFDDDIVVNKDTLFRLLEHRDRDIVTGLYLMRSFPHQPIIFDYSNDKGECKHHYPDSKEMGLIEIVNCGLGCCLIKTDVFRTMEKPWIRLGELEKDHWCDDIGFFNRARQYGYKLYCDLSIRVGHMTGVTVWPNVVDGKWMVSYDTRGTSQVIFPAVVPEGVTA